MLLFRVESERWAIAASEIQAVIPLVDLQKMPHSHPTIAGLLNYHGQRLPVVDVSVAIAQRQAPPLMSTRIVIIEKQHSAKQPQRMGLIVDRASKTEQLTETSDWIAKNEYAQATYQTPLGESVHRLALASFFNQAG